MDRTDFKDYVFGDLSAADRRALELRAAENPEAREEIARLQTLKDTLGTLKEEEVPRRIAFVSDPVFEPRWWQRIWRSGPQLGFVSAGLLAAAILAHGVLVQNVRTATPAAGVVSEAELSARVEKEVNARLDAAVQAAVARAVADLDARRKQESAALLAAAEQRFEQTRREDLAAAAANLELIQKQMLRMYAVSNAMPMGVTQ
jgi:uncharacterized protein YicC (UPF0701 family)